MINISTFKYNILFLISFLLGSYVFYMLMYFKTKKSFNYGNIHLHIQKFLNINKILEHPLNDSHTEINHVCPLGHFVGILLFIFLALRFPICKYIKEVYKINSYKYLYKISLIILILMFIGSFMNLNVVVYLIPYFIIESIILLKIKN